MDKHNTLWLKDTLWYLSTSYVGTCYMLRVTQYEVRLTWVRLTLVHVKQYVPRGYPYTTSPRSLRFKVGFRFGNGFTFWI